MSPSRRSFDRAAERIGASMDQVRQARLDLQEERKKCNQLVEQCDMLAAALMCLMQKHKYTQVPIRIEDIQVAIEAKNLNVSGDAEEEGNVLFTIENKKIAYDEFVKGVSDDNTNPETT